MGMDQYICAETGRGWWRKSVCVAYWRKNYQLSDWIDTRLSNRERKAYDIEPCAYSHQITAQDLALLDADYCKLAEMVGVHWALVWALQEAMEGASQNLVVNVR